MADPIKQEILIDINLEQDDATFTKLANLKGALQGLKTEQQNLKKALQEGVITQKEYNSELVRVEALQKRAQHQYNVTQRSVTGLKNPFDKLNESIKNQTKLLGGAVPALDRVSGGAASAAQGIFSMVRASLAFLATPIGLAIAALGVALVPLISYLKNTGEGADIVTREMEGFKSVLQGLKDEINQVGKSTFEFLKSLTLSIPGLNTIAIAYDAAAQAGRDYADAIDEINDAQENFSIQASQDENLVKRLLLQAKNRTLSEQERIDLINQALSIEATLVQKRIGFAQDEFSAIVTRNEKRLEEIGIIREAGETQEDFVTRSIDAIRDFDEGLATSLINSIKKLEEARSSGIAIEEKAQNQLDALAQKREERDKKTSEENIKRSEEERKRRIEDFDAKLEQDTVEFEAEVAKQEQLAELDQQVKDGLTARLKTYEDNKKKQLQAALEFESGIVQARINLLGQFGATLIQLAGRNKALASAGVVIERAAAIANVLSNTGIANAKAVAASPFTLGQPWVALNTASALLSITSIISSAAQSISQINSAKFARGGIADNGGVLNGRSHAQGGIPFSVGGRVGFEAEGGEAIINKRSTALFRRELSAINQAGGGRAFATGGITGNETRIATANATAQLDFNQLLSGINQIQTVLVLEQFEAKKAEVDGLQRRATVISR